VLLLSSEQVHSHHSRFDVVAKPIRNWFGAPTRQHVQRMAGLCMVENLLLLVLVLCHKW
jgi:hypothetical protein